MANAFADPDRIEGYHAHIYYHPLTRAKAERVREGIGARFVTRLGNWHDEPVGPHPVSMTKWPSWPTNSRGWCPG